MTLARCYPYEKVFGAHYRAAVRCAPDYGHELVFSLGPWGQPQ